MSDQSCTDNVSIITIYLFWSSSIKITIAYNGSRFHKQTQKFVMVNREAMGEGGGELEGVEIP